MPELENAETVQSIDILENDIVKIAPQILGILLQDKTTKGNIMWCTKDYESYGPAYEEHRPMKAELITGELSSIIQPRAAKPKEIQKNRIKNRAEVFTPSWVCNEQNNLVDEAWFGREHVFNTPSGTTWSPSEGRIEFPEKKTWKAYVTARRLEITCGEAPYLVSRYDTTTGAPIPVYERIGLFDRKMRIVNENCQTDEEWLKWSYRALQSVYGFEFQGDSILIAIENLLYDFIDYYKERFAREPAVNVLKKAATIIAWNLWQMDGLKYVVPYSCHDTVETDMQLDFFGTSQGKAIPCPGCAKGDATQHNGIYCRVYDWKGVNKSIPFISLLKEGT